MEQAEQLCDRAMRTRVDDACSNLIKGDQDKDAVSEARVRNGEISLTDADIIHEQDIQVERARAVGDVHAPIAAELVLDFTQCIEQLMRGQSGFKSDDCIEKAGLGGIAHRRRRVQGGFRLDVAEFGKSFDGNGERIHRFPGSAGEIGSECDVCRAHGFQSIVWGWSLTVTRVGDHLVASISERKPGWKP